MMDLCLTPTLEVFQLYDAAQFRQLSTDVHLQK